MSLVEKLENALDGVVEALQEEIEALEQEASRQEEMIAGLCDEAGDYQSLHDELDRLALAVEDYAERGLIDRDELLRIARYGNA